MKKHTTLKSKFNSAFSLVELLVVIAVIAVIAAIAIPNITGAREAAVTSTAAYNADSAERFITQVNAVGATNGVGSGAASTSNLTGVFSAVVGSGTNTNTVTFTYTP
ncbi:MAG: prepilin-type N-terminal cleavage/methylation domain-containing protein [Chthoniobacterales bacterium]